MKEFHVKDWLSGMSFNTHKEPYADQTEDKKYDKRR